MSDHIIKHVRSGARLPKGWKTSIRSAVLQSISLAKYSLAEAQSWASERFVGAQWWKVECQRLQQEVGQLREELRIKDARMAHLPPHRRSHYPPVKRMAIQELKASRNWSLVQTARTFLVTTATIAAWLRRLGEQGPEPLVRLREPVNKFQNLSII